MICFCIPAGCRIKNTLFMELLLSVMIQTVIKVVGGFPDSFDAVKRNGIIGIAGKQYVLSAFQVNADIA